METLETGGSGNLDDNLPEDAGASGSDVVKQEVSNNPVRVDVGGRVSYELNVVGQGVNLKDMFAQSTVESKQPRVTRLFVETSSGNIYSLDLDRNFINANKSAEQGTVNSRPLHPEYLGNTPLEVGSAFSYVDDRSRLGYTTSVARIVAITNQEYPEATQGSVKKSDIQERFDKKMSGVDGYISPSAYKENVDKKQQNFIEFVNKGSKFELKNIIPTNIIESGQKEINVFFETESKNLYCLKPDGTLISVREIKGGYRFNILKLDPRVLGIQTLEVGSSYVYPGVLKTTHIEKFHVVSNEKSPDNANENVIKSPLEEEFNKRMKSASGQIA